MARIGFIGLGNMGGGMAANLAKKGHDVRAFDLSADALAKAKAAGKASAIYAATASDARRYREMGYGMICVASDVALLRTASNAIVRDIRA